MSGHLAPRFLLFWQPFDASMRQALAGALSRLHRIVEEREGQLLLRMGKGRKRLALELRFASTPVSRELRALIRAVTETFPLLGIELSQIAPGDHELFLASLESNYEPAMPIDEPSILALQLSLASAGESRAAARFSTHLPAKLQCGEVFQRTVALNLSSSGIFLATRSPPPLGSRVQVELSLPDAGDIQLVGRVVRIVRDGAVGEGRKTGPGVGVQLLSGSDPAIQQLVDFLGRLSKRRCRVMVADDCQFFQRAIGEALGADGCEVIAASDGREAIAHVIDEILTLDVLVLDLQMPNMNGSDVLDRVRRLGGERDLRIVIISGSLDAGTRQDLMIHGADVVLDKSVPITQLVDRVRALTSPYDGHVPAVPVTRPAPLPV